MNQRRAQLAFYGGPRSVTTVAPWPPVDVDIQRAIDDAYQNGSWGKYHGGNCDVLAGRLAAMHKLPHCWLCASGTVAVELALRGLKVGPEDEVILAGYDFAGNFRAVDAVGARPVLVDIDPATWCLDGSQLAGAASDRVRAVIVSHLHGGLADMPAICEIAKQRGWSVVEDACQSTAAQVYGRIAGTWGDVSVLSFGGSKLLTAGRGGAVLTRQPDIVQRIKIHAGQGNNAFPLSELQAAVLLPQLEKLLAQNEQRRVNAARLLRSAADLPGLTPVKVATGDSAPVFYKFAWLYDSTKLGDCPIDEFVSIACAEGIPVDRGFRGFARRGDRRCRKVGDLPHSARAADATLLLHHPILLSDAATIDQVAAGLRKIVHALQ